MQISSGWAKGLRLKAPQGESTRPTAAKVRAAALNMLVPVLADGRFLDLYAGSGGMGIEAVSRGSPGAVFIEHAAPALTALRSNLVEARRRAAAQRLPEPELTVLSGAIPGVLSRVQGPFAVIFVDPPYRDVVANAAAILAAVAPLAAPAAVLLFESAAADAAAVAAAASPGWSVIKQRAYGETLLTMLEKV